jgi:ribosome-binding ATPase
MSFQVRKSFKTKTIEIYRRERKCLHHYLYLIDPEFGFMHVRIQGWIPYDCQIYINGREWLARRLDEAGVGYLRHDNALLRIEDLDVAAKLCDEFAHRAWPRVLNAFAKMVNPLLPGIRAAEYGGYYWVLDQAEIATDVMFTSRPKLLEIWPDLVHHAAQPGIRRRARLLGKKAPPLLGQRGGDRHQASARGLAGPTPHGPQLGEDVRQGVRSPSRDGH